MGENKVATRDTRFQLRLSEAELVAWQAAAQAEDLTLSQWLRRLAKAELERRKRRHR